VALSVAVGLILFLAERDRRSALPRARRDRRFELLPGERPPEGLRRIAAGQLDRAIELLDGAGESVPAEQAVHDTRKALKRLRAVLRLASRDVGELERVDGVLRDTGLQLAGAREAEVMLATLDSLIARHPRKLARLPVVVTLRAQLLDERERATGELLGESPLRGEVLTRLRVVRAEVAAWQLSQDGGIDALEAGLRHTYRQGRRRLRRVASGRRGGLRERHEWRKRTKRLRYGAQVLGLERLARHADELAELLGEERDLALLARRIERDRPGGKSDRRMLLKRIERRRRKLRKRALARGRRLYRRTPAKFGKRMRGHSASRAE
jgi:CHAD domain-containing protein